MKFPKLLVRPSDVVRSIEDSCITIVGAARVGTRAFKRKVSIEYTARQLRTASLATRMRRDMTIEEQRQFTADCAAVAARYEELMAKYKTEEAA